MPRKKAEKKFKKPEELAKTPMAPLEVGQAEGQLKKAADKALASLKKRRAPAGEVAKFRRLRFIAGMLYITDPNMPTVEDVRSHPDLREVGESTMASWCQEDKWLEKRKQQMAAWQKGVADRLGEEINLELHRHFLAFKDLFDFAMQEAKQLPPTDFHALIRNMVEISIRMENIKKQPILPQNTHVRKLGDGEDVKVVEREPLPPPSMSEEEFNSVIAGVLAARRKSTQTVIDVTQPKPPEAESGGTEVQKADVKKVDS